MITPSWMSSRPPNCVARLQLINKYWRWKKSSRAPCRHLPKTLSTNVRKRINMPTFKLPPLDHKMKENQANPTPSGMMDYERRITVPVNKDILDVVDIDQE